jgi:hypothetical protein
MFRFRVAMARHMLRRPSGTLRTTLQVDMVTLCCYWQWAFLILHVTITTLSALLFRLVYID